MASAVVLKSLKKNRLPVDFHRVQDCSGERNRWGRAEFSTAMHSVRQQVNGKGGGGGAKG